MFALGSASSDMVVLGVVMLVLGFGLISLAKFWPSSAKASASAAAVEPAPAAKEITGPVVAFAREIAWPRSIDPDAGVLSESERRVVVEGLGIVGDAWCARILAQAYDEEDGELRVLVVEALGMCESGDVAAALERAYTSYVVAERYAAIDGASRRGDVALLERGMRDTDGSVALAAAYGLHRAKRGDLVDGALDGRDDARANEIRRVLPILV
ncbi:MAG TPA: hypothetical protein VMA36_18415 [Candidatus Limnocylindria bacterium]|nr:hypothetical protein [Candidatus Limnocylindria bacterium]